MEQLVLAVDPIICIFSYLGPVSLCRAAQVSKNWLVASEDTGIWSNLWRNLFVFEGDERMSLSDGYNKSSFINYFKNHGGNFRMDFDLEKVKLLIIIVNYQSLISFYCY
jgi:hypothetical protein